MIDFEDRVKLSKEISFSFGHGWMSRPARDMLRIALFAGFDRVELVKRLVNFRHIVQERYVLQVMSDLQREFEVNFDD